MKFVERELTQTLRDRAAQYPVVSLTGPRQSGKSTLLKRVFPDYRYVSLEDPDRRLLAIEDPRGFLANYPGCSIIDEAQRAPELFSYIQGMVDDAGGNGIYILSGSQNFLLQSAISQSLAGRTAMLRLFPFSYSELACAGRAPETANTWIYSGGYPRIYDQGIPVDVFHADYTQTYLERDVRTLRNVGDLNAFSRFLKICAGHTGQILNLSALANACDINIQTVKAWLSVLEASYVVFFLRPYHNSVGKRIIKSPKLYFFDTGIVCSLLGISSAAQMDAHYMKGLLFENMVISEIMKRRFHNGSVPALYYWRDSNGNEVDLVEERDGILAASEIKSSQTMNLHLFREMRPFTEAAGISAENIRIIYGGKETMKTSKGSYVGWEEAVGTGGEAIKLIRADFAPS
jgi:predicted AAA+ superfamily ATPase